MQGGTVVRVTGLAIRLGPGQPLTCRFGRTHVPARLVLASRTHNVTARRGASLCSHVVECESPELSGVPQEEEEGSRPYGTVSFAVSGLPAGTKAKGAKGIQEWDLSKEQGMEFVYVPPPRLHYHYTHTQHAHTVLELVTSTNWYPCWC